MINIDLLIEEAKKVGMTQKNKEIYKLIKHVISIKPKHVMEIGSRKGGTFYLWNRLSSGKKISLDLTELLPIGKKKNQVLSWGNDIYIVTGNSRNPTIVKKVKKILNGEKLDFLFIDGDHRYPGVKSDYKNYKKLVKKGGWIAFHDINPPPFKKGSRKYKESGSKYGVHRLWKKIKGEKLEFVQTPSKGRRGMGIGVMKVE